MKKESIVGCANSIVNDKDYNLLKLFILEEIIKSNSLDEATVSNGTKGALKVFEKIEDLSKSLTFENNILQLHGEVDPDLDDSPRENT